MSFDWLERIDCNLIEENDNYIEFQSITELSIIETNPHSKSSDILRGQ